MSQYHEYFTFDGIESRDFGVWISGVNTWATPERDVEVVQIPGRNGTLTLDNNRWKNITITYPCYMSGDFKEGFDAFKNAILPKLGYLELSDTYHPRGYRRARLFGGIKPVTGPYNRSASFLLSFDCWPQFYLYQDGEQFPTMIMITNGSGTISDIPLVSRSKPIIMVYFQSPLTYGAKSGSVTVGGKTITFTDMPYATGDEIYFSIDSEARTITHSKSGGTVVDVSQYCTGEFFEITPPATEISYSGANFIRVIPRWWEL